MGYLQGSQTRSKYKNTDSAQNHVDRVRVPDSNCQLGGPGRGSGWRHRSLSNIDLTSQSKHSFTKQTRGYTSSLHDLYSRLDNRKDTNDLENLYGNANITSAEKVESIYDRIEQTLDTINKSESCSLRRTRSLAVIREETFNDLQIGSGIRSRRSQLIPRAKLLNRSFFQNRTNNNSNNNNSNNNTNNNTINNTNNNTATATNNNQNNGDNVKNISTTTTTIVSNNNNNNNNHNHTESSGNNRKKYRGEDDSGSGVDTQTSETRESDDYYGNLKKVHGSQVIQPTGQKSLPPLWVNDKSDLDSLDSDYFKNSLHQLDGSGIYSYDSTSNRNKDTQRTPDQSIGNGYVDDNLSLRSGEQESSPLPDYCTIKTDEIAVHDKFVSAEDVSVIHVNGSTLDTSTYKANSTGNLCDTTERRRLHDSRSADDIERKPKFKEDHKSVISYDSIYLSSEGSNEAATIIEEEEKINEYLSDNNYSTLSEYTNIKKESNQAHAEPIHKDDGDNLYSQINKPQSKVTEIEPTPIAPAKTKLTTFSDISNRGTLERLTFISSPATGHNEANGKIDKTIVARIDAHIDNQYCSLPLANIGKSLQASERIDAKLRSCYPLEEQTKIYDSITNFGRAHKKLRQRESNETNPLQPIPLSDKEKVATKKEPEFGGITNGRDYTNDKKKATKINTSTKFVADDDTRKPVKVDEESLSVISTADLNEIDNTSSKNCEIDEIRENPEKIRIDNKNKPQLSAKSPDIQTNNNIIEETVDVPAVKVNRTSIGHKSYQKSHYFKRQYGRSDRASDNRDRLTGNLKVNLSNTLKRRLESKAKHTLNDKLTRNLDKSKNSKNTKVQQAIIENIKTHLVQPNFNMSRPQIMHVVDSKRNLPRSALRLQNKENEMINVNTTVTGGAKKEMLQKVDSVRSYWSRLIQNGDKERDDKMEYQTTTTNRPPIIPQTKLIMKHVKRDVDALAKPARKTVKTPEAIEYKAPILNVPTNVLRRAVSASSGLHSLFVAERDELNSYTPSVEIVELDDQKQAAIVKVQGIDAGDFDHVRYKVMKTDTFQKDIFKQTRKHEAPLDGLLQYLNDYSFQELLTQNNVVIIEPVRTKIEQIASKPNESQILTCKITAGANKFGSDGSRSGLRKHFFYHPIRVNKELLDEELPSPDTVRKAKKLFEDTLLLCPMKKQTSRSMSGLNETCRNADRKYLTLEAFNAKGANAKLTKQASDGSYGGTNGNNVCNRIKKWDSSSLSSGVSSGDLSSPCDCNDNDDTKIMSNESGNELCESYYVSQDILEKIRECGSSVTYYGGRVLNNQSPEVSPMTKAIMREIRNEHNICEVCQPNNCPHSGKLFTGICDANKGPLGMKLRLIKSNSCNSRLELAGTRFNDGPLHKYCFRNRNVSDAEDTVRTIIQRIETNSMQDKHVPRIIESRCIEKAASDASKTKTCTFRKDELYGLAKSPERLGPLEILSQVNVKNHINAIGMKSDDRTDGYEKMSRENPISRNKDVDLAIQLNAKSYKETTNNGLKKETAPKLEKHNGKTVLTKAAPITATVRPTTMLTKTELEDKKLKENHKQILQDLCKAVARSEEEKLKKTRAPSYEKNFFANDAALKRTPKYDDIEFEEFEVNDPKK